MKFKVTVNSGDGLISPRVESVDRNPMVSRVIEGMPDGVLIVEIASDYHKDACIKMFTVDPRVIGFEQITEEEYQKLIAPAFHYLTKGLLNSDEIEEAKYLAESIYTRDSSLNPEQAWYRGRDFVLFMKKI